MERAKVNSRSISFLDRSEGQVLGYAVWYTFSKVIVHKDEVKKWFDRHGLYQFTPADPKHGDAFKRICSEYKERKIKSVGNTEVFLLVRPLEKGLRRGVVLERRADGKRLSYDVIGEIAYNEKTRTVGYTLDKKEDVEEVVKEIVERWEKEKDCYTEEHLRKALQGILNEAGKVKLKPSGSVYFVPAQDFMYVERFSKIVEEIKVLNPDNNTEIWFAPIMNTDQFRNMIKTKVEDTLQETLDSVIRRLIDLKEKEDIDEKEKARRIKELAFSIENAAMVAEKYTKMLQTSLSRTSNLLENAQNLLAKLKKIEAQVAR